MLSHYFKNYFVKLETIHCYHTHRKTKKNFFNIFACTEWGRTMIQRKGFEHLEKNIFKTVTKKLQTNGQKEYYIYIS